MFNRFAWLFEAASGEISRDGDLEFYTRLAAERSGPVLEIACGVGRVLSHIIAQGKNVYGIDASPKMLDYARGRLTRAMRASSSTRAAFTVAAQDQRNLRLPRRFPLALIPWNGYLNLPDENDRAAMLQNILEHLEPGGVLALDADLLACPEFHISTGIWTAWFESPEGTRGRLKSTITPFIEDGYVEEVCDFEFQSFAVSRSKRFFRKLAGLTGEALLAEIASAGFDVTAAWSDFAGAPFTGCETRVVVTARKPAA